ncbi:hypothetical protein AVEN_243256-1 [Araneus ventricosus]|uniref:Uncharacterized protein n=1 Tax=Araneus ventricosus TaxID=182803 RepID=A0A4Y2SHL1_ARAVE|nr:hypothetical protein AVEN_243256-1 [Araneus ventricosus]
MAIVWRRKYHRWLTCRMVCLAAAYTTVCSHANGCLWQRTTGGHTTNGSSAAANHRLVSHADGSSERYTHRWLPCEWLVPWHGAPRGSHADSVPSGAYTAGGSHEGVALSSVYQP